jgi:phage gp46-like protein
MADGWIAALGLPIYTTAPMQAALCSGDIKIQWDNANARGDWLLASGDIQTGQDLESSCLVSLFTDAPATPDFVPTDGTTDRRGWWATPYLDQPLGSNLWELERAKKTRDTLGLARRYALDALQWLVDDGVAATVEVDTQWLGNAVGSTFLGILVIITEPNGSMTRFTFGWAWDSLAVLTLSTNPPPLLIPATATRAMR